MELITPRLVVGCLLDEFSYHCFKYECDLIPLHPNTWNDTLSHKRIDFILCESAWKAYDSDFSVAYKTQSSSYVFAKINELVNLAKLLNIPTVFWNKEDNLHFHRFLPIAKYFDYIFTTDDRSVSQYKKHCKKTKAIDTLIFAAQPVIHNPIGLPHRKYNGHAFFPGTWYKEMNERNKSLYQLISVPNTYKVDIYDRRYTDLSKKTTYPKELWYRVKPSISYEKVIEKFKEYPIMMNVNTVVGSNTMFSRRVPEALASGVTVLTVPSKSIRNHFPHNVYYSKNKKETINHLYQRIQNSGDVTEEIYHGIREVFLYHTYHTRLQKICKTIGINVPTYKKDIIVLLVSSPIKEVNEFMIDQLKNQKYVNITNIFMIDLKKPSFTLEIINNVISSENRPGFIGIVYSGNLYEKYYFIDLMQTFLYTKHVDIVGKGSIYFKKGVDINLLYPEMEHIYTNELHPHTLFVSLRGTDDDRDKRIRYLLRTFGHLQQKKEDDEQLIFYSGDKYNFLFVPELNSE